MGRIEQIAEAYARHIQVSWQKTVSGAQRVLMIVYDKELERTLVARRTEFANRTRQADFEWAEIDLKGAFSAWMAEADYRDAYFESPDDLRLKLNAEFGGYVADRIRGALQEPEHPEKSVVGVFGVGALFGFVRMSQVLQLVERDIQGRLAVFFPGQFEGNNYRLLDARDGWNYMAVPITLHEHGGTA